LEKAPGEAETGSADAPIRPLRDQRCKPAGVLRARIRKPSCFTLEPVEDYRRLLGKDRLRRTDEAGRGCRGREENVSTWMWNRHRHGAPRNGGGMAQRSKRRSGVVWACPSAVLPARSPRTRSQASKPSHAVRGGSRKAMRSLYHDPRVGVDNDLVQVLAYLRMADRKASTPRRLW
jgi:hypothetical protein